MEYSVCNAEVASEEFAVESRAQTNAGVGSRPDARVELGMIGKSVNEATGFRAKTAKGLENERDEECPFRSCQSTIAASLFISRRSSGAQTALAGEVNEAVSRWVRHTDINQKDLRTKNYANIRASSIHPKVLSRLDKTLSTSAMNPVSNDINAGVMTTDSFRAPFVREDVPRVRD